MNIIAWIILGALAGWIASMIMKTNEEQGAMGNIIVGIIGALIGGFAVTALTGKNVMDDFGVTSLFVAIIGSVVLLGVLKAVRRPTHKAE